MNTELSYMVRVTYRIGKVVRERTLYELANSPEQAHERAAVRVRRGREGVRIETCRTLGRPIPTEGV